MEARQDQPGLEALLGPGPASGLRLSLRDSAAAFAGRVAGGAFHTARPGTELSAAVSRVYEEVTPSEPLLVVWPVLVRLGDQHAAAALEDLQSGADVVFGPVIDGGLYLLGLRHSLPDLLEAAGGR